ncbi:MAG: hypothetical protein KDH94_06305, partial [Coxiellaceae bacterium]|nr:hypothetical protein [Coxiellaceae bacterium]
MNENYFTEERHLKRQRLDQLQNSYAETLVAVQQLHRQLMSRLAQVGKGQTPMFSQIYQECMPDVERFLWTDIVKEIKLDAFDDEQGLYAKINTLRSILCAGAYIGDSYEVQMPEATAIDRYYAARKSRYKAYAWHDYFKYPVRIYLMLSQAILHPEERQTLIDSSAFHTQLLKKIHRDLRWELTLSRGVEVRQYHARGGKKHKLNFDDAEVRADRLKIVEDDFALMFELNTLGKAMLTLPEPDEQMKNTAAALQEYSYYFAGTDNVAQSISQLCEKLSDPDVIADQAQLAQLLRNANEILAIPQILHQHYQV